jgi:DNA polymerase I
VILYGWDTETWSFWEGNAAPPMVCLSVSRANRKPRLLDRRRGRRWIRYALARQDVHLVGHNIAFDLGVVCADQPELIDLVFVTLDAGRLHDTGIRESLLDLAEGLMGLDPATGRKIDADEEGASYPLTELIRRYLSAESTEEAAALKYGPDSYRLRYREFDGIPTYKWPLAARVYPKGDARNPAEIYWKQQARGRTLVNGGNLHAEPEAVRKAFSLQLQTLRGLRTHGPDVDALDAQVEAKHLEAQEKFKKAGIVRENGTEDKKKIQELVTEAYGGNPPYTAPSSKFPKGQIATDRDTKLESGDPLLVAHGKSGKNNKYRTTYLPKLRVGTRVPINPRYYGMAATTRVTADYQQLPQKGGIRECHRARAGFAYCSVDYEGLELRTMSQRAISDPRVGYSKMAEALLAKMDPHTIAAASFLGRSYESLVALCKVKGSFEEGFRSLGKVFNFGKGGGMGHKSLVYNARAKDDVRFCKLADKLPEGRCGKEGLEEITVRGQEKRVCVVCIEVGKELDRKWLDTWTEQRELCAISSRLHREGHKTEVMIPVANIVRGGCTYTQWLNTPFQGLGAVLVELAMWRVTKEMFTDRRSALWGSRLVLNVHDELIAEIRTDDGHQRTHDAAERMAFLMREAAKECLPDLAPTVAAEPALSFILSKKAETVRDSKGILQIWEPAAAKAA